MVELRIKLIHPDGEKIIVYSCDETTVVKDLLIYLYDNEISDEYKFPYNLENSLIGHFSFVSDGGYERKARLNYALLEFLNNFNYDVGNIKIICYLGYGIGGYIDFEEIARIQINADEPTHNEAHVHITRIGKRSPCYRIHLDTLTQMKGDAGNWSDEFKNKERKEILKFLEMNREKIKDYYDRCRRGEYIQESYILYYDGENYFLNIARTY